MLIALAIGAIVASALWFAHRSLRRALGATVGQEDPRAAALAGLAALADDLRCAWDDGTANSAALQAAVEPDGRFTLAFLALRRPADEDDPRYARPHRVTYETRAEPGGGWTLYRSLAPLRPPAAGPAADPAAEADATARPIARYAAFRMEFLDGENWSDRWPATSDRRLPRAARIDARDRAGRPAGADVWIARDTEFAPAPDR